VESYYVFIVHQPLQPGILRRALRPSLGEQWHAMAACWDMPVTVTQSSESAADRWTSKLCAVQLISERMKLFTTYARECVHARDSEDQTPEQSPLTATLVRSLCRMSKLHGHVRHVEQSR
jgi:hypothetical protein